MKILASFAFFLSILTHGTQAEPSVEDIQVSYQAALLKTDESRDRMVTKLNQQYTAALEKLQDKAQKSGNLEQAIAIKKEAALLKTKNWPLPPVPEAVSRTLGRPRQTYLKARIGIEREWAISTTNLTDKMEKALEQD